jgi:hypothetical protein
MEAQGKQPPAHSLSSADGHDLQMFTSGRLSKTDHFLFFFLFDLVQSGHILSTHYCKITIILTGFLLLCVV